jgi:L-seryl-tRNA(Ser) seleniumtransferase
LTVKQDLLRKIPSVDELLNTPKIKALLKDHPRSVVVDKTRTVTDGIRKAIAKGTDERKAKDMAGKAVIVERIKREVDEYVRPNLRHVVNATGVVLHTNLGRSILADEAVVAVVEAARYYSNLEFDLKKNARGSRHSHIEELLVRLTGAEEAMAVNNNASAVLLALSAIAKGKEVIVSRGQLVEIGGSFRIPDVMSAGGARLREVGTTNKTYIRDYKNAITEKTALLMRVHPSNFRVVGFSHEAGLKELVDLGKETGLPVLDDLGSGVMVDLEKYGITGEPTVQNNVKDGADLVTFSGDKLMGGPQAGLIVGSSEFVSRLKKHPMARAVRIDKMTLAAMEATLRLYLDEKEAVKKIPTLRMLTERPQSVARRAKALASEIKTAAGKRVDVSVRSDMSKAGGGSLPLLDLPTTVVCVDPLDMNVNKLEERLRFFDPPILARISEDKLVFDVRTIQEGENGLIVKALTDIARNG